MKKNKKFRIYKFAIEHKVVSALSLFIFMIIPIFVIDRLYKIGDSLDFSILNTIFQAQDILNYSGVIVGTFATFSVLYFTIKSEKNERKEDRRYQVYPYVRYKIINTSMLLNHNEKGYMRTTQLISFFNTDDFSDYDIFYFYLAIENIGVNTLVNFSILETKCLQKIGIPKILGHIKVNETNNHFISIEIAYSDKLEIMDKLVEEGITVTVAYTDIVENYYEQNIKISFYKDSSGSYIPEITQDNITKPELDEYKNIFEEIKKRKSLL